MAPEPTWQKERAVPQSVFSFLCVLWYLDASTPRWDTPSHWTRPSLQILPVASAGVGDHKGRRVTQKRQRTFNDITAHFSTATPTGDKALIHSPELCPLCSNICRGIYPPTWRTLVSFTGTFRRCTQTIAGWNRDGQEKRCIP